MRGSDNGEPVNKTKLAHTRGSEGEKVSKRREGGESWQRKRGLVGRYRGNEERGMEGGRGKARWKKRELVRRKRGGDWKGRGGERG